jgi:hypothetical protein
MLMATNHRLRTKEATKEIGERSRTANAKAINASERGNTRAPIPAIATASNTITMPPLPK